jgi:ribonucleoside-triphosphate reductase
MIVIKRDGRRVPFQGEKIVEAVLKAFEDVDGEASEDAINIANQVADDIEELNKTLHVETIQDLVEEALMGSDRKDVARAYVIYRNDRSRVREINSGFMGKISEKLQAKSVENQNANVDERSFGGRIGAASSEVMKQYALDHCMSEMSRNNHLNNEIYIHDLDHYAVGDHNCLSIPFDKLLANGFNTRQTDVRPAQSVNTAFQLVAVIFQLQSLQQFGGVSATHLDHTMVPYVRKSFKKHLKDAFKYIDEADADIEARLESDEEFKFADEYLKATYPRAYQYAYDQTEKETYQAVEGMYHNLNTLQSRSGCQLPFTSINYGTCTEPEGRMVTKALLNVSIKGIGRLHKTSIFPCGIFQCMKGVNRAPGDPNYDLFRLALRSTAQRLYPNYANVDWSGNAGYDRDDPKTYFSTMGKRKTTAHVKPFEPCQGVSAIAG